MKKNQGITLMSLIVTIVILLILAGVSIRSLTGSKGLINQAKETKTAAEMKDIEEQIELVLVKAELKSNNVTMESVIKQLINAGLIDDESQVNQDTGDITFGDYVLEEKLADYVITPGEKYYGNKNTVATSQTYFTFTVNEADGTATITGVKDEYAVKTYYNGEATNYTAVIKDGENYVTDVVIPYEYVDENGKKYVVTGIGDSAFGLKNSSDWDSALSNVDYTFTSFVLPNTITTIGSSAFRGTTSLERINIPSDVTTIGTYGFTECAGLPSGINLSNATNIGYAAFQKCTTLINVKLGEGLNKLSGYVFMGCINLKNINIPKSVTGIETSVFYKCSNLSSLNIPDSVTSIGVRAFCECTNLNKINIPDTVITIGDTAFMSCESLTNITIPNNVTTIDSNLFRNCINLSTVNISNNVTAIGNYAFHGCTSLNNIDIPDSVTDIGEYAFANSGLNTISISDGLTKIGSMAFYSCTKISSINIPSSVTTIGKFAFGYWTAKQTINCEILESDKPDTWDENWSSYSADTNPRATINWGVSM